MTIGSSPFSMTRVIRADPAEANDIVIPNGENDIIEVS
jgi:hypothetical protein